MNKYQKEIQDIYLKTEAELIEDLKANYEQALEDVDAKIAELLARNDIENLSSIIYQVDYQRAIRGQISAVLDQLHANNFTTISSYLTVCYENAWIGTLYDLQKQGIPLLFPINQDQVVKAIKLNTKLSKPLYNHLGIDIKQLKQTIRSELSRGISQSYSYEKIASNIRNSSGNSYNNSIRIARTEGHRITQEATYDAQVKAKEKGADIMKQWCATLDMKTRDTHQYLDGQIVKVDEPFVNVNGEKAMYPGGFGIAREDINCRCCLLQRAKWALTNHDFTKMNGETNQLQHFKDVADYNEFKEKFWKWSGKKK